MTVNPVERAGIQEDKDQHKGRIHRQRIVAVAADTWIIRQREN